MAELAGLSVGVVALIGVFKDCVDLFSYISAAATLGRDYEIMDTKLDVEKTLFLQWAERVRLVKPPHDNRLEDPTIQKTVARILASVRLLLSESKELQHRYGLEQVDEDGESSNDRSTISGRHISQFIREFNNLKLRIKDDRKNVSPVKKVR